MSDKERKSNADAVGVTAATVAGAVILGPIGALIGLGAALLGKKAIEKAIKDDKKGEKD